MSNFVAISFFKQPSGQIWLESDLGFCPWVGDSVPVSTDVFAVEIIADLYCERDHWQIEQPFEAVRLNAHKPLIIEHIARMKYSAIEVTLTACAVVMLAVLACLFNVGV